MRFVVSSSPPKAAAGNGRARAGALYAAGSSCLNVEIETPSLLISTRKGLPNFITRDLLASFPLPHSRLLHVSPLHFFECPPLKAISSMGGLHQMVGLQESIFIACAREAIESLPESGSTNKLGASFETPSGRRLVKPLEYVEMISSLRPNLWASLADEVPAWVSEKRNKSSVDRTIRWLDDCLYFDKVIPSESIRKEMGDVDEQTEERLDEVLKSYLNDLKEGEIKEKGWPTSPAAYKLSKVAMSTYTRILANKYPTVCANCVAPGFVKTDITNNMGVLNCRRRCQRRCDVSLAS